MRVKALVNYQDLELGRLVKAGESFEVLDARAEVLIKAKVVEPTTPEVDTKAAPKKKTAPKKKEG